MPSRYGADSIDTHVGGTAGVQPHGAAIGQGKGPLLADAGGLVESPVPLPLPPALRPAAMLPQSPAPDGANGVASGPGAVALRRQEDSPSPARTAPPRALRSSATSAEPCSAPSRDWRPNRAIARTRPVHRRRPRPWQYVKPTRAPDPSDRWHPTPSSSALCRRYSSACSSNAQRARN